MDEMVDQAIGNIIGKIKANMQPDEYMKLSQSVLNMAHAKTQLATIEMAQRKTKGVSAS